MSITEIFFFCIQRSTVKVNGILFVVFTVLKKRMLLTGYSVPVTLDDL